jgi:hypothetical protein
MRAVPGALLTAQKQLHGKPTWALTVGATTLTDYLLGYDYAESLDRAPAAINLTLNNSTGYFNSNPPAQGAVIELKRGIGSDLVELPRLWVEGINFTYGGGRALCVVKCMDWLRKLAATSPTADQSWTATSATTILEWILTQAGLTRLAGAMTAPTLTFTARATETLATALRRLLQKIPEYLYPGIDGEIKWKTIPTDEASCYTFGWNAAANHKLIHVAGGSQAWRYNTVTVNTDAGKTGTATNAAQIALVNARVMTFTDNTLSTDAQCVSAAQHYLNLYAAEATQATLTCRPCHGLELLDVVTVDNPPWGGDDIVGRVIQYRETHFGSGWTQSVALGGAPLK